MSARPVLLIDNDSEWCERVCRFLAPHGINVLVAHDEAAALKGLAEIRPSAILVEPTSLDPAFRDLLTKLPELKDVPAFVVSAAPARAVYDKRAGISGYVRKAVALEHLMFLLGDANGDRPADTAASQVAAA